MINFDVFGAGGVPESDDNTLASDSAVSARNLQTVSSSWNPPKGESGTSTGFSNNPSGISLKNDDNSSASVVIAKLVTLMIVVLGYIML